MKYTFIFSALLTIPLLSNAQTQVIKCIDDSGSVTYHNQKINGKGMKCNSTNLATIDQLKNSSNIKVNLTRSANATSISNSSSPNNNSNNISSEDKEYRELKRREILMAEKNQEKKQLELVNEMIAKANKKDETQMRQLTSMLQSHQSNINALEKELKIEPTNFTQLVSTVIPGLGIPKTKDSENKPQFQIEGATVINPPSSTQLISKDINTRSVKEKINTKEPSALKIPDLDSMRGQLNILKRQRENIPEDNVDKSQHIEIKRRQPGVNISQASIDYQPLPTPLSVPDLGIGR